MQLWISWEFDPNSGWTLTTRYVSISFVGQQSLHLFTDINYNDLPRPLSSSLFCSLIRGRTPQRRREFTEHLNHWREYRPHPIGNDLVKPINVWRRAILKVREYTGEEGFRKGYSTKMVYRHKVFWPSKSRPFNPALVEVWGRDILNSFMRSAPTYLSACVIGRSGWESSARGGATLLGWTFNLSSFLSKRWNRISKIQDISNYTHK